MKTPLLSVIIPGRKEEFFARTVETVLERIKGESEVIAICDETWPDPPLNDHPRLTVVHPTTPVGQRGGVNLGARVSRAKYIMKLDAHCSVDEGFDVKLAAPYEDGRLTPADTTIPRMFNLHAFDWQCRRCNWQTYQNPVPLECPACKVNDFTKAMIWQPRKSRRTDFSRFDHEMHFQYWTQYAKQNRPGSTEDIADMMCSVGACFFMRRDRFWALGGLDENHGGQAGWGQFGVEVACKSWLSGGRHVVNKTTWFSHMFRTNQGFTFPYKISGRDQERAREYSRDLWMNNRWPLQRRPLKWLIDHFAPIPGWHDEIGRDALAHITAAAG